MKLLVMFLSLALFVVGCTQPKNRLADEKNLDYQKRMQQKSPQTKPSELVVVDVKPQIPAQPSSPEVSGDTQTPQQKQSEVAISIPTPVEPADEPKEDIRPLGNKPVAAQPTPTPTPAPTPTPEPTPAPAATPTAPKAEITTPNEKLYVTFDEFLSVLQTLAPKLSSKEALGAIITTFYNSKNHDGSPVNAKVVANGNHESLSLKVLNGDTLLTQIENAKLLEDGKVLEGTATNNYGIIGLCSNKCNLIFITFFKIEDETVVINLPFFLKKIDGQYVQAALKSDSEYEAEAKARKSSAAN